MNGIVWCSLADGSYGGCQDVEDLVIVPMDAFDEDDWDALEDCGNDSEAAEIILAVRERYKNDR